MNLRLDKTLTAWVNKKNCKKKTCKKSCNVPCPEEVDPCDQERYLFKSSCEEPRRLCNNKIRYARYPSGVQGVALPLSQQPGLLESRRLSGDSYDRRGRGPTIFVDSRFDQRRISDPYNSTWDCIRRPEPELTIVRRPPEYDMIGVNPQCRHPPPPLLLPAPCDMLDNSRYDPYDYEPPLLLPPPIEWDEYERRRCRLDSFNNHGIRGYVDFGSRRSSLLGYNANPYSRFGPCNRGMGGGQGFGEDSQYGPTQFEHPVEPSGYRPQNDLSKQQNNYEEARMNYDHRGSIGNNNRPLDNNLNNNNIGPRTNGASSSQQQSEQQQNNQNSNNNPPPPPSNPPPPPPPPPLPPVEEHYYQPPPQPSMYQVSPRPLFDIGPSGIQSRVAPPEEIIMSTVNSGGNGGGGGPGNDQWNESGDPDALLNGTTENNAHSNGNNSGNNPDGNTNGSGNGNGRLQFEQGGAGGFRPGDDLLRNGFDFDNTGTSNMNGGLAPNDLDRFYNNNSNNKNNNSSPYNNKNGGGRGSRFGNFGTDGKRRGGTGNKNDRERDRRPPCDQSCLQARGSYCSEQNQNFCNQGPIDSCNFDCCRRNEYDPGINITNNSNNCCTRSVCGSSAPLQSQQQQQQQQSQRCSCCPLRTSCDCHPSNSQSYSNPIQQLPTMQQQQQQQQCQFQCQNNCCKNGFCQQQQQQPQACLCSKCQSAFVTNDCNMSNNNNNSNGCERTLIRPQTLACCPTCNNNNNNNNNGLGLELLTDECETRRAGGTNAQYILDVLPSQLQSDNNNTDNTIISSGGNNYILEECILPRTTCRAKRRARKNLSCSGGTRRQLQVLRCQNNITTNNNNNNTSCNNNEDYSNCKKLIPILAISTDT